MFLRRQGQSQSRAATTASASQRCCPLRRSLRSETFAYDRWLHWHRRYRIAGTSRRARCQTAKVRENYDLRDATRILINPSPTSCAVCGGDCGGGKLLDLVPCSRLTHGRGDDGSPWQQLSYGDLTKFSRSSWRGSYHDTQGDALGGSVRGKCGDGASDGPGGRADGGGGVSRRQDLHPGL